MIHFIGAIGLQIPQWVIGNTGQMNHGIEACEIFCVHIANVLADLRYRGRILTKCRFTKQT